MTKSKRRNQVGPRSGGNRSDKDGQQLEFNLGEEFISPLSVTPDILETSIVVTKSSGWSLIFKLGFLSILMGQFMSTQNMNRTWSERQNQGPTPRRVISSVKKSISGGLMSLTKGTTKIVRAVWSSVPERLKEHFWILGGGFLLKLTFVGINHFPWLHHQWDQMASALALLDLIKK